MSAHDQLRQATRAAHDRVDRGFAALDLSVEADYATFLQRHSASFIPVEQALTQAGADALVAGWTELSRSPALLADLADLGIDPAPARSAPTYSDPAAVLGGAYVLEGSRLGGALLRRSVAAGLPRRFLDAIQPQGRWRAFIAQLNQGLYDQASIDRATKAALETFALFDLEETGRVR